MPPSRKLLVAIAAGVALAAPPVAGFNLWLNHLVEQQGQEELDVTAGRSIGLAEVRASQALEMLDTLAARGVDSCRPEHIEALRQATFATTPVKEHSIIAPDGRTLCSDVGSSLEARKVVSSELIAPDSERVNGGSGFDPERGEHLLEGLVEAGDALVLEGQPDVVSGREPG